LGVLFTFAIWFFIPKSVQPFEYQYHGIELRYNTDTHVEGVYHQLEEYDYPLERGPIFKISDPEKYHYIDKFSEYYQVVNMMGFLFWQTGMAYGFDTAFLKEFRGFNGILRRLELSVTVGPVALIESFIYGTYRYFFILMMFQLIWVLLKKEHIWWAK